VQEAKVVGIIGQGYVGLPLAMSAVKGGWKVIGIDSDSKKLDLIGRGKSPVEDVADFEIERAISEGSYRISDNYSDVSLCDAVVLCLPTPLDLSGQIPDIQIIESVCDVIAPKLSPGTVVINESTSFPGTLKNVIIPRIRERAKHSKIFFATAPERVDPSNAQWSHKNTPRLVAGVDEVSTRLVEDFYKSICDSVVVVRSPEVAEYAKLLENSFRQVNIALVTQISHLCALDNISIFDVLEAASTKPYGFMAFRPSVGVGGHCIPIDPLYLSWYGQERGLDLNLVQIAQEINNTQPRYIFTKIKSIFPSSETRIVLNGLAYKYGVSDLRESPNVKLLKNLRSHYKYVKWHDEKVSEFEGEESCLLTEEFDLLILAHPSDPNTLRRVVDRNIAIFDCSGAHNESRESGLSL